MYKKKLEQTSIPELKSIYDNDLQKSIFNNRDVYKSTEINVKEDISDEGHVEANEENCEEYNEETMKENCEETMKENCEEYNEEITKESCERDVKVEAKKEEAKDERNVEIYNEYVIDSSSNSEKSITFNRIKKKVVRKYMLLKNKIKTSSIDYKLDLINDAINKINSRINLLEIKVSNIELDVNKNKNELIEYDRITTMEMTNINDKLNNANIIILD
jgi:hypothetical protein